MFQVDKCLVMTPDCSPVPCVGLPLLASTLGVGVAQRRVRTEIYDLLLLVAAGGELCINFINCTSGREKVSNDPIKIAN